ncbi:hypothetical protein ACNTMW_18000 [Planosporangium sp. 12N6]|uniref:hypothetical protein n=1 Tax=Planosporangium spinosum TaxID=3402278 RepID=UPI003CE70818
MISRRSFLGTAAGAGALILTPGVPAFAADTGKWTKDRSANGWTIEPGAVSMYRIEGSKASVALRQGLAATVLLHVARRWHYEIAPLGTGEGTVAGHTNDRTVRADFESNYLSGTAIALYPNAYPVGGSEKLTSYQEVIVRDILADCDGTVVWGGDLDPATCAHFHLMAKPADKALSRVADRLDPSKPPERRSQVAGMVADPASPARRALARRVPRPR